MEGGAGHDTETQGVGPVLNITTQLSKHMGPLHSPSGNETVIKPICEGWQYMPPANPIQLVRGIE